MKTRFRNPRDVFAGLIFVAFGAAAIWFARDYPVGNATRMGPGYFPIVLGALLLVLGIVVGIRGVLTSGSPIEVISPRAVVLVLGAVGAFAATLESAGIIVATILLVGIGAAASAESKPREVLVLTVVMLGLAVGLFYYGLGLPFRLLPV
jgi:hypothetical protein